MLLSCREIFLLISSNRLDDKVKSLEARHSIGKLTKAREQPKLTRLLDHFSYSIIALEKLIALVTFSVV